MAKTKGTGRGRKLQHLDFVRVMTLNWIAITFDLYEILEEFIKMVAGPLVPLLRLCKRAVLTILAPIYNQFGTLPFEILYLIDISLDKPVEVLNKIVPIWVRLVFQQGLSMIESISGSVRRTVHKARMEGLLAAVKQSVREFYRLILFSLANAWVSVVKLPLLGGVVGKLLPSAKRVFAKYNKGVIALANKGFSALTKLPFVDQVSGTLTQHKEKIQQGISEAGGKISEAIQKGAGALNPVQVVKEANKAVDAAVAVTGQTISNAVGIGSTALNAVTSAGEASLAKRQEKIEEGLAGVKGKIGESLQKGGQAVGGAGKVVNAAVSAAGETASYAAELGATTLTSVLAAGNIKRK